MTIYTHAVVGLGIGMLFTPRRMPCTYWIILGVLPVLPDLDSFSDAGYGSSILGHRGFSHSLCFALAIGLAEASFLRRRTRYSDAQTTPTMPSTSEAGSG